MASGRRRYERTLRALWLVLLLAGCGGGGGGGGSSAPPGDGCSVAEQNRWLATYFDEWYFWNALAPRPDPAGFASVGSYFRARLYTGTDAAFPADRWSGSSSTESFNRFFEAGSTLGYGIFVAGNEVLGKPELPLVVRYVEPLSDAAAKGIERGDRIVSVNGQAASDLIGRSDFSLLTPERSGDTLDLVLRRAGTERRVQLVATVYALSPVTSAAVVATPHGRRVAYLHVKDMISQVQAPLAAAFTQFGGAAVQELVLDLRYNGGGLVSTASELASMVAGARGRGQIFTTLLYNEHRAPSNNQSYRFSDSAAALGLPRVYVLTGSRTCSAAEQVINGLRPFVDVVLVGDTTCGKPVGFNATGQCGTTYSVVNFESVNARGQGRYFDGFAPDCKVTDDLAQPLGAATESLLAAALAHADSGRCPTVGAAAQRPGGGRALLRSNEPGQPQGLLLR